jgi:hypothetical protein
VVSVTLGIRQMGRQTLTSSSATNRSPVPNLLGRVGGDRLCDRRAVDFNASENYLRLRDRLTWSPGKLAWSKAYLDLCVSHRNDKEREEGAPTEPAYPVRTNVSLIARHPARNADTLLFGNRSDRAKYLPARRGTRVNVCVGGARPERSCQEVCK